MATPRKKPEDKLKPGPPTMTEVDPKVAKAICDNLSIGMPVTLAAEAEGIGRRTAYDWMERFPAFAAQVSRAKASGAKNLSVKGLYGTPIRDKDGNQTGVSMKGSAAALWMLERRYREDYGAVTKIITADEDDFTGRDAPELEAERERLKLKLAVARDDRE
jgi:hypothetical protein